MKYSFVLVILFSSVNAFAGIQECTQVLRNMGSLTKTYTEAYKICRRASPGSTTYQQAQSVARQAENLYAREVSSCRQVCGGDANSLEFCEGTLSGACP